MADAEQSAIDQLSEAIGMVVTGNRVARNQTARKNLQAALVRFVSEHCQLAITTTTANTVLETGGLDDAELTHIREWLLSERAGIAVFEKAGKEYPGHLAVNICEKLLNEVDRLRGRK